jgi:hypothetical protein
LGNIESIADSFGLRVSSVLITESESSDGGSAGLQRLASRSGGASYSVSRGGRILAMYSDLVEAMRNLIAVDTKVPVRFDFQLAFMVPKVLFSTVS